MNISPSFYESRTPSTSNHSRNMRRMTIRRISEDDEQTIAHDRIFRNNYISQAHSSEARASRTISTCSTRISSTSKTTFSHLYFSDSDVKSILKSAYEALDNEKQEIEE
ncbi:predicted protein [Chaetoceros tenuissimus]|uniref:Uncharacterized protein n=1 Tax=Chaetoceros tenuissimus TaxID=426638 RepID=A0AAD3HFA0_9STRA|nr:predicted protein [Chaetoceros tenuissimus]